MRTVDSELVGDLIERGCDRPIQQVDALFAEREAADTEDRRRIDDMLFAVASSRHLRPAIMEGFRWIATDPNRSEAERSVVAPILECLGDSELEHAIRQDLAELPWTCKVRSGPWELFKYRGRVLEIHRESTGTATFWSEPTGILEHVPGHAERMFPGGTVKNPRAETQVRLLNDGGRETLLHVLAGATVETEHDETEVAFGDRWQNLRVAAWMGYRN